MDLISMVDYSMMPIIQKLSVAELNVYSSSTLRILEREYLKNYAELLREKISHKLFSGDGKIFDGWLYGEDSEIGIWRFGSKEIVFRKEFNKFFESDGRTEIRTVEGLVDFNLKLNKNGVDIVRRRRKNGYFN